MEDDTLWTERRNSLKMCDNRPQVGLNGEWAMGQGLECNLELYLPKLWID